MLSVAEATALQEMLQRQGPCPGKGSTHSPPCLLGQCHTPQSPGETLLPTTLAGTCRLPGSLSYNTGPNRVSRGEHERFPCRQIRGNSSSTFFLTHLKFGSASLSRSRLAPCHLCLHTIPPFNRNVSGFHKAIHSPPKSFPSFVPARGLHNPQI